MKLQHVWGDWSTPESQWTPADSPLALLKQLWAAVVTSVQQPLSQGVALHAQDPSCSAGHPPGPRKAAVSLLHSLVRADPAQLSKSSPRPTHTTSSFNFSNYPLVPTAEWTLPCNLCCPFDNWRRLLFPRGLCLGEGRADGTCGRLGRIYEGIKGEEMSIRFVHGAWG